MGEMYVLRARFPVELTVRDAGPVRLAGPASGVVVT